MKQALATVVLAAAPVAGIAQVMIPVPPAAERAPAWQPPAEPPKAPPLPVEADVPTPNIVKQDAEGRLLWPSKPPEVVAFEAIQTDGDQKASWSAKWTARQSQLDELIVKNLAEAIRVRQQVMAADQTADWNTLINLAGPINKSLSVQPSLEQFVRTAQILRPKQLAAFNEAMRHFRAEAAADLNKRAGSDTTKVLVEKSRDSVKERSQEGLAALDRMAAQLCDNWAKTKSALALSGDFAAAEKLAADAKDQASKAAAGLALLEAVAEEKRAEVLGTFRTPAPTLQPPADPATSGVDLPKPIPAQPAAPK